MRGVNGLSDNIPRVETYESVTAAFFWQNIFPKSRPAVLKNVVGSWPSVGVSRLGTQAMVDYLKAMDNHRPMEVFPWPLPR